MGPRSSMLVCLLFAAFFCSQINSQAEDEENAQFGDESYDEEKPLTAADQYLNFIASGGKTTDDIVPEEYNQEEGGKGQGGYGPGQELDQEYDYGTETLNLLLSKPILYFLQSAPTERHYRTDQQQTPIINVAQPFK